MGKKSMLADRYLPSVKHSRVQLSYDRNGTVIQFFWWLYQDKIGYVNVTNNFSDLVLTSSSLEQLFPIISGPRYRLDL